MNILHLPSLSLMVVERIPGRLAGGPRPPVPHWQETRGLRARIGLTARAGHLRSVGGATCYKRPCHNPLLVRDRLAAEAFRATVATTFLFRVSRARFIRVAQPVSWIRTIVSWGLILSLFGRVPSPSAVSSFGRAGLLTYVWDNSAVTLPRIIVSRETSVKGVSIGLTL